MFKFPDQTVGIVAIQGDYEKHRRAVEACGAAARYVKVPEDLEGCGRVIIPGGESTTVGQLMQRFGLADALIERVAAGLPVSLWRSPISNKTTRRTDSRQTLPRQQTLGVPTPGQQPRNPLAIH
jgi:hypothetical protein